MTVPYALPTVIFDLRVIRSFQFPGCSTVKPEVVDHLFDLCSSRLEKKQGVDVDTPMLSMDGEKLASPALLIKVLR